MLKYEIIINSKLLRKMENDIWNDELLPAVLKIGDNRYKVKLSYRGSIIRERKKKSFRVVFQKPFMVEGAHEIHLNAEYSDISLCRNKLSLDFFDRIGVISPHSKHVLLYINGFCKGIYLEIESFDQYLLKRRNLPQGTIIYATNDHANFSLLTPDDNKLKSRLDEGYTLKYGEKKDFTELQYFIALINSLKDDDFEKEIQNILDVDQYLKWLSGVVCTQNYDGFIHNYALYKNKDKNLYEISPWDYDGTWGRNIHGDLQDYDYVPITGYNTLTGRLLHLPHFKMKYKVILSNILENDLTLEVYEPIIKGLLEGLKPYLDSDPFIKIKAETLEKEKEVILKFIENRTAYLKTHLNVLQ